VVVFVIFTYHSNSMLTGAVVSIIFLVCANTWALFIRCPELLLQAVWQQGLGEEERIVHDHRRRQKVAEFVLAGRILSRTLSRYTSTLFGYFCTPFARIYVFCSLLSLYSFEIVESSGVQ